MEKATKHLEWLQKKIFSHQFFLFLFTAGNILFLVYLIGLAYYDRMVTDDYCFLEKLNTYGFWGSIWSWYNTWQGRLGPYSIINSVIKYHSQFPSLFLYVVSIILLYYLAIFRIIKNILAVDYTETKKRFLIIANFAVFLFNIFAVSNFEFSTLYWLNVSTMYFGGILFALIGIGEILSPSESWFSYIIIAFSALYAGSSAENFGSIIIFLGLIYMCWLYYSNKKNGNKLKNIFQDKRKRKFILAFVFLCIAFIAMVMAPGNELRRAGNPKQTIFQAFRISLSSYYVLLTLYIPAKIKYLSLLVFPSVYSGCFFRRKKEITNPIFLSRFYAYLLLAFLVLLWICLLPTAYAIGNIGPDRSLTHIAFYLVLLVSSLFFTIGSKTQFPKKLALVMSIFTLSFYLILGFDKIYFNLQDTAKHADSLDQRTNEIAQWKKSRNNMPLELERIYVPINNSFWYEEIGTGREDVDNYWKNNCIMKGLGLDFELRLKKQ